MTLPYDMHPDPRAIRRFLSTFISLCPVTVFGRTNACCGTSHLESMSTRLNEPQSSTLPTLPRILYAMQGAPPPRSVIVGPTGLIRLTDKPDLRACAPPSQFRL
jgi:hypothetical protein